MKLPRTLASAAIAALFLATSAFAGKVGEPAQEFTLTDTNGNKHSLADYSGKTVVLEWVNHGCPYVKKYYDSGSMQALQKSMTEKDVVWLTICSSAKGTQGYMSNADWNKAIDKHGKGSTAVLIDERGTVGRLYGATVTPHMYVIDPAGVVAYNGAIDSMATTRQSDIDKAEPLFANAVTAVLAGQPVEKATNKPYGCGIKYAKDS